MFENFGVVCADYRGVFLCDDPDHDQRFKINHGKIIVHQGEQ